MAGLLAIGALVAVAVSAPLLAGGSSGPAAAGSAPAQAAMADAYGELPLRFEANGGRTDPRVRFLTRGAGYSMFFTPREAVLSLSSNASAGARAKSATLRMGLRGADPSARIVGAGRLAGVTNHIHGSDPRRWTTGVAGFSQLTYQAAYPGIDVVFHGRQRELEYDFVVAPGADPGRIGLDFDGADRLKIDARGDLVIATPAGEIRQRRPVSYQTVGGTRRPVESRYVLSGRDGVRFELGAYDRRRPLVIDPVISYQSYLGGSGDDSAVGIAVDPDGNGYVTGSTTSTDFPTQAGPGQTAPAQASNAGGESEVFVTKISPDGSRLIYSSYLGGGASPGWPSGSGMSAEQGWDVVADAAGSAYVSGSTQAPDFPTSAGAYRAGAQASGGTEVFVVKLGPAGTIDYSTLLGPANSASTGIALAPSCESSCAAYVSGSPGRGYPATIHAIKPETANPVYGIGFVTKLDPDGKGLGFSAYIDGRGADIAVDGDENVYVTGDIRGTFENAPPLGYNKDTKRGGDDAFLTKIKPDASAVLYSTYLGGNCCQEDGRAVAVDASQNAYVAGFTTARDFPTTTNALQPENPEPRGAYKAFVSKLDTKVDGQGSLLYSTFVGGNSDDWANGLGIDAEGIAYVTGQTRSEDFPTKDPVQDGGGQDAYVVALDPSKSGAVSLVYATRLGGTGEEEGTGIAVSSAGEAYVVGRTSGELPWVNAFQEQPQPGNEVFVTKLARPDGTPIVTGVAPRGGPPAGGTPVTITGTGFTGATAVSFGDTPASGLTVVSNTEIRTTSPAHAAGAVSVRVTNASGTSPNAFTARYQYGPWRASGRLNEARLSGHTATLLNTGKVLVAGGADADGTELASAELYDPVSGEWTETKEPMTKARRNHTATMLADGKVLVTGGLGGTNSGELYDPSAGTWTATAAPMAFARHLHSATLITGAPEACRDLCGKVMIAGGRNSTSPTSTQSLFRTELYNPATKSFETQADLISSHSGHIATLLSDGPAGSCGADCGKVMVVGSYGRTGQLVTRDVEPELFEPATRTWRATTATTKARYTPSGLLLPDGRVLVAAGSRNLGTAGTAFREVEAYDPSASSWTPLAPLITPRNRPAVALYPDGKLLLAGGDNASGISLASAELYDPAGRSVAAGSMLHARGIGVSGGFPVGPTATLLPGDPATCGANCGRVLVVGGTAERTTELYDPISSPAAQPGAGPTPEVPPENPPAVDGTPADAPAAAGGTKLPAPAAPAPGAATPGGASAGQGGVFTAKVSLARARIYRRDRLLDVFAPISARASGRVGVELHAAGRRYRFTAAVNSQDGRIRLRQRIPGAQADLGMGIVTLTYRGDADTRPQTVRLRAASQRADLRLSRPTLTDSGRLRAAGTISERARGVVRVQLEYVTGGRTTTLQFKAPIAGGRWSLNEQLSQSVRRAIARRRGTLHSYTLFTGYMAARMRGEMRSFQVGLGAGDGAAAGGGGVPGPVQGLTASARSSSEVLLSFLAAGSNGTSPPPARRYVVKQSLRPITSASDFTAAQTLCGSTGCAFEPATVGERLTLTVDDLRAKTTYYYTVAARSSSGRHGPRSPTVRVTTK